MRQPQGGLPGIDLEAALLVRVPVYGFRDSGRGFWVKVDKDAKEVGLKTSKMFPSFYFHRTCDEVELVMTTHVDDFLWSCLPSGEPFVDKLLSKYEVGTREEGNLRFCGKRFICKDDAITIDVADNTRKVTKITIDAAGDRTSQPCTAKEISTLRSVIGSLSWIARQGPPDLSYRVSRLQTMVKGATKEANKVVDLATGGLDVCIRYPTGMYDFNDLGVVTVTDASFAGEPGMKSQQGRMHFLCPSSQIRDPKCEQFTVLPIPFASTAIRRVCRATLWHDQSRRKVPHLLLTDCRSLHDHLNADVPATVSDKRLQIELNAMRQSLFKDTGARSTDVFPEGGDRLRWIETSTMIADALTKSMKPAFLLRVLLDGEYRVCATKQRNKE